jgi:hypothetical protein
MVVLAIIGILLAMVGGGLLLARRAAHTAAQSNDLRQVGFAWGQYNVDNEAKFVPGLVSTRVQRNRRMGIAYPDHTPISPAPSFEASLPNTGGPWTWRLVEYLSNNLAPLLRGPDRELLPIFDYPAHGTHIAYSPAFAYNGWYVGGHWTMSTDGARPLQAFRRAPLADRSYMNVVVTSAGKVKHPTKLIVFAPGTLVEDPGVAKANEHDADGWFEVTPPWLADVHMWEMRELDNVEVFEQDVAIPWLGADRDLPVFHADGHVETLSLADLSEQDRWIDPAKAIDETPASQFTHEPE